MSKEQKNLIENIRDIANPEITTIVEFEPNSTLMLGGVLVAVIVIAILVWALAKKYASP